MLDPTILTEYNHWRDAKNKEIFCHAPFTNVNFSQNGDATACCYNRSYVLRHLPGELGRRNLVRAKGTKAP